MSVDKFGHYLNDTSGIISIKNAPKLLGFFMDGDNHIDVQNKRIRNVSNALEANDVVNKMFLQSYIEKSKKEIIDLLEENIKEIREILINMKIIFEEEIRMIREKIYKFEHFNVVTIDKGASTVNIQRK